MTLVKEHNEREDICTNEKAQKHEFRSTSLQAQAWGFNIQHFLSQTSDSGITTGPQLVEFRFDGAKPCCYVFLRITSFTITLITCV